MEPPPPPVPPDPPPVVYLSVSTVFIASLAAVTPVVRFSGDSWRASSNGTAVHFVPYRCVSPPPCLRSDRNSSLTIDLHRKSHLIPPQPLPVPSIPDALDLCFFNTDVRGIPHLTRVIDLVLCRFESLYSHRSYSISAAVKLTYDSGGRIYLGEDSPRVICTLPLLVIHITPYLKGEPLPDSSAASSTLGCLVSSDSESFSVRRRPTQSKHEMGFIKSYLDLANPTWLTCPHLLLLVSQPISKWGGLVFLSNPLKVFGGFTFIFTETDLHSMLHFSCTKNLIDVHLLVDSSGSFSFSSSLASFFLEKRTILPLLSSLRNVSPPNTKWSCVSLSITILSSCVAVRLGPEDATDIVSMIFRGADWILTSRFKVTKSQVSGAVVILVSTHSSIASSSLSFYLRGFSTFMLYVFVLVFVGVWLNSLFICSSNV